MSAEDKQRFFLREHYDWGLWAHPKQALPEGKWNVLVMMAGRGGGKTRAGAEAVIEWAKCGRYPRLALVARDAAACRDVMVEGPSGVLACSSPLFRPEYEPSKRRLTWPNGVTATHYAAEEPKSLRGPQFYKGWADEVAAWRDIDTPSKNAWNQLVIGTRLGDSPQLIVTSTPTPARFITDLCLGPADREGYRPVTTDMMAARQWHYDIAAKDGTVRRTIVRQWSTRENEPNLGEGYVSNIEREFGESRLGRQELEAEIAGKLEGALWTQSRIDRLRVEQVPCELKKIVVAVDPTRSESPTDECGIVVVGLGSDGRGYVLDDKSMKGSPNEWLAAATAAYRDRRADYLVYEKNRMGKSVEELFTSAKRPGETPIKLAEVQATQGKKTRAEPVSALYEQGKVSHVGWFRKLEDEMVTFEPDSGISPNRMDALVWGLAELLLKDQPTIAAPRSVGTRPSVWRP